MKDYYDLFVTYSMSLCSQEEYSNKQRIREHNASMKKLLCLQAEMDKEIEKHLDMLIRLLVHNNEKVRINAAEYCLKKNVYKKEAVDTLNNIAKFSLDMTLAFSAKTILDQSGDGSLSSDG